MYACRGGHSLYRGCMSCVRGCMISCVHVVGDIHYIVYACRVFMSWGTLIISCMHVVGDINYIVGACRGYVVNDIVCACRGGHSLYRVCMSCVHVIPLRSSSMCAWAHISCSRLRSLLYCNMSSVLLFLSPYVRERNPHRPIHFR